MLIRDYTGDGSNSRELDLGDDYDFIEIRTRGSYASGTNHGPLGWALRDIYGCANENGAGGYMSHRTNAQADLLMQGKMTGGDVNKIKLGSSGTNSGGYNESGVDYRILARKYSTVQA